MEGSKPLAIHDGNRHDLPGKPALPLVLSPNGTRWLCHCVKESGQSIVLDGKQGKTYVRVTPGVFSPDSQRFAYSAMIAVKEKASDRRGRTEEVEKQYGLMVRNGSEQKRFAW